jgi:hypothetical protein
MGDCGSLGFRRHPRLRRLESAMRDKDRNRWYSNVNTARRRPCSRRARTARSEAELEVDASRKELIGRRPRATCSHVPSSRIAGGRDRAPGRVVGVPRVSQAVLSHAGRLTSSRRSYRRRAFPFPYKGRGNGTVVVRLSCVAAETRTTTRRVNFDRVHTTIAIEEVPSSPGLATKQAVGDAVMVLPLIIERTGVAEAALVFSRHLTRSLRLSCLDQAWQYLKLWAGTTGLLLPQAAPDLCHRLRRDVPWIRWSAIGPVRYPAPTEKRRGHRYSPTFVQNRRSHQLS